MVKCRTTDSLCSSLTQSKNEKFAIDKRSHHNSYVNYSASISSLTNFVLLVNEVDPVVFSVTHSGAEKYFRQYEGEIQVKLERSDVTLLEGRYEGEIYIHVLVGD